MLTARHLLIGVLASVAISCLPHRNQCSSSRISADWRLERPNPSLSLTLRLPHEFEEEYADESRFTWMGDGDSYLGLQVATGDDERLFDTLPTPEGKPEYRRCVERVSGLSATIVTYNLRQDMGDLAFTQPFQVYAEIVGRGNSKLLLYGAGENRKVQELLVAVVRSIRWAESLRVRPNTR